MGEIAIVIVWLNIISLNEFDLLLNLELEKIISFDERWGGGSKI